MPDNRSLVVFANRMPIVKGSDGWREAVGGLATALRPALERHGGAWVGWDGGARGLPQRMGDTPVELHPVRLSAAEITRYYQGFCNRTLWPLLHDLVEQPVFDWDWWETYRAVNRRFADAAAGVPAAASGALWVHDYHFMLLPELLRAGRSDRPIAFFLHTPFPAPELFARLPWRRELLRGLLGSDLVAFHIDLHRDNFLRACRTLLDEHVSGTRVHLGDGRTVRTASHPISIDAEVLAGIARDPGTERAHALLASRFKGRKVILGVDRLDYTKGILQRLEAMDLLLERRPDLRSRVALVQVAAPSRDEVEEYGELRGQIEREVGRINGEYTEPGQDVPVYYLHRLIPRAKAVAYYRLADVALVTPLKDGMNLVAKEFVVVQAATGRSGALVLSEFAGAAEELRGAILCNPFDVRGLSEHLEEALELDEAERARRIGDMAKGVHAHTVHDWVDDVLCDLDAGFRRRAAQPG
jgi:trehalose 6-phosphate synthase